LTRINQDESFHGAHLFGRLRQLRLFLIEAVSEEILVQATEQFFAGKTQVMIAHRLSTLLNCDRILWLHNGEIKMIGTPKEVLPIFQDARL
jgi:ABC-type transport system involved in Fe-S cluster assembly fused permease/ATPase subunit